MATQVKRNQIDTNLINGWTPVSDSWAYASASTITVPSGAASIYQKGDRIKWTQTTVKYGVIVAVADTLLTIAVNTDYVVTNAAISANYYSHQANPIGYPHWFNYTPTYGAEGSMTFGTVTTTLAQYSIIGTTLYYSMLFSGTTGGSADAGITFTVPVNRALTASFQNVGFGISVADDALVMNFFRTTSQTTISVIKSGDPNYSIGAGNGYRGSGFYNI